MSEEPKASSGRYRREKREIVKAKILSAARTVFAERGYDGTSLERVAEAAGFSKGAVYSNFANKDELFFELLTARIDERLERSRVETEKVKAKTAAPNPSETDIRAAAIRAAEAAGRELRVVGEAEPEWQLLFLEFWLRCARNEELRAKFAEKRAVQHEEFFHGMPPYCIAKNVTEWAYRMFLALSGQ